MQATKIAHGHLYAVLNAHDIPINGRQERIVKIRNPHAQTKWRGTFSEGSREYKLLDKYFKSKGIRNEKEGGRFYMRFKDMLS